MKCIIVEDEFPAREELKYYLSSSKIEVISEFSNSQEALEYLHSNDVDVIFLDINIPGLDGISLAKILKNFQQKPKIVFITAYKDYALEAFELEAFDYLLKPYSEERINRCINKLLAEYCSIDKNLDNSICQHNKVTLWQGDKMIVTNIDEILFVEACERECKVFTKDEKILISRLAISKFETLLPTETFFRSHRSYIVNIQSIREIIPWSNSTYMIKLGRSEKDIPVSRNKLKEFRKLMHIR